jgi:fumarylacetoacetate (FAA) hydrolase
MKLATIKDATRDGQLAVVSRDLGKAALADSIAGTLQHALDDWSFHGPQLQDLYDALNQGKARNTFDFDVYRPDGTLLTHVTRGPP